MQQGTSCKNARMVNTLSVLESMISALRCAERSTYFDYFADRFNRFLSLTSDAVPGEELILLNQLILILYEKLCENYELYEHYFLRLMEYCSLPIKTTKTNDLLIYEDDIYNFYNACAYILGSTQNIMVIRHILKIFVINSERRCSCTLKDNIFAKSFIRSKFTEIFSELLLITEFHIYLEYLSAMEHILVSDAERLEFIKYNIIDIITKRMVPNWMEYEHFTHEGLKHFSLPEHLHLTERILWLLVNAYIHSSAAYKNNVDIVMSKVAWRSVRHILIIIFTDSNHRKERNTFYLVIRLIWTFLPARLHPKAHTELNSISFLSEIPCKNPNSWLAKVQFFPDSLDFEFKVTVMSMLCAKKKIPYTVESIRIINAVPALLIIIDINEKLMWTSAQRRKLVYYALVGLQNILRITVDDFLVYNGPERLLQVIQEILNATLSFHLIFPTLSCINTSLDAPDCGIQELVKRYQDDGAVRLMCNLLLKFSTNLQLSKLNQSNLSILFCILRKLEDPACKTTKKIIDVSHVLLKRYLETKSNTGFLQPKLLIAVMTYLWDSLMWIESSLEHFISWGGIYTLLDIIERFPLAIKLIGLSMLCDFCERSATFTCLLTWRGKDGITIVPFLLKLYREQSKFDQQRRNSRGNHLKDAETRSQHLFNFAGTNTVDSSVVLLELLGNCKPKISAMLQLLTCSAQGNIINETYRISSTSLSSVDKITAAVADHYFNLKLGEAWIDVNDYFRLVGYSLLEFDQTLIEFRIKQHERYLDHVLYNQTNYQLEEKKLEAKLEYTFYNELREQLLNEALDALKELKAVAISSRRRFKVQEYNHMINQLGWNRIKQGINVHKTLSDTVQVNIFGNKVSIRSDIVIDPNAEEPLKMVSPPDSLMDDIFEDIRFSDDISTRTTRVVPYYKTDSEERLKRSVDDY